MKEYEDTYIVAAERARATPSVREAARIELGLRAFLEDGGFKGFTTTFEDLHGLHQLPGLAVPAPHGRRLRVRRGGRLEDRRPGARHEGHGRRPGRRDLVHGGLHLPPRPGGAEGAGRAHAGDLPLHRATANPSLEIHPLGIGGKDDPARLVFNSPPGPASTPR